MTKVWNLGKFTEHALSSSLGPAQQQACVQGARQLLGALSPGLAVHAGSVSMLSPHLSLSDRVVLLQAHALVRLVTRALLDTPPGCVAGPYRSPAELAAAGDADTSGGGARQHSPLVSEAARAVYDFVWGEYAAWYVEANKLQLQTGDPARRDAALAVNAYVWLLCLQLLHPFAPFITESLWISLLRMRTEAEEETAAAVGPDSIMLSQWPGVKLEGGVIAPTAPAEFPCVCPPGTPSGAREEVEARLLEDYAVLQSLVRAVRTIKAEHKVDPGRRLTAVVALFPADEAGAPQPASALRDRLLPECATLEGLCKTASLRLELDALGLDDAGASGYAQAVAACGVRVLVPLEELRPLQGGGGGDGDGDAGDKEAQRLEKQRQKLLAQIARLEERLAPTHPYFLKANPANVEQTRAQLARAKAELDSFR